MIEVLDDPARVAALAPEWAALWARTPGAAPFQHPAWLLPWWEAFGTPHLRMAVARQAGALCGVLPAYVLPAPMLPGAEGPKLLPVGAGTSDYLDALGGPAEALLGAVLDRAARDGVGRCDLIELPPESALRSAPPPAGWVAALHEGEACPVLALPGIPAGIARKLRMSRHRAGRAGGWSVRQAEAAGLAADLETLFALHRLRWSGTGGVLGDPAVPAWLHGAAPGLLHAGLLRLAVLSVAGAPAAAVLALLSPGRLFFYMSGYDPAQRFVSPGTLLVGAMLEQAAAEGRTEAHFLRGREGYKYAWGAQDRMNATRSLRWRPPI